ncbi:helix-turn-helix domain-containing protein [Streptomyces sp. NPDC002668]|uniref:helix-turn-helix domain-containing protein n=1 Tax=Streptomyces sp. NPDC002668 TaxID=3154422 RepID=UPI003322F8D2
MIASPEGPRQLCTADGHDCTVQPYKTLTEDVEPELAVIEVLPAQKALAIQDRLIAIVLEGGGITDVANAIAEVLLGDVHILDTRQRIMHVPGTGSGSSAAADVLIDMIRSGDRSGHSRPLPPDGYLAPIIAGNELLGALVLVGSALGEAVCWALERAAVVLALLLRNERTVTEAEHRIHGEIFDDLFTPRQGDFDGLRRRAALAGLYLDEAQTILVTDCRDRARRRQLSDAATRLARQHGGLAGEHVGTVVVVVPTRQVPAVVAAHVAARLTESVGRPVTVGASVANPEPAAFADAYRDANRCLNALLVLERDGQGATLESLGVYGLLFTQTPLGDLSRFIKQTIGPVLNRDSERSGELLRTLATYFACDGHLARTAATLHVHVNTLYQRIDRIGSLLGADWRNGDQALQIHLAIKLQSISPKLWLASPDV